MYSKCLKRVFDIILVLLSAIFMLPAMFLLVIIVRIYLGSPVMFKQQRPGLHGKIFTIYKFRTMEDKYNAQGLLLEDKRRMTRLGSFLRKFSLDELPELFNVLKGDMSLVGPRPLLVEYLPRYSKEQARRHEAKPGITGLAQVNGRNAISWKEKFALDVWYVDNQSFLLDLKIIGMTIIKVFKREGISCHGHVTMEKFYGEQ